MRRMFVIAMSAVLLVFAAIYGMYRWREQRQNAQRASNAHLIVTVSARTVRYARIVPRTAVVGEIVAAQGTALSLQTSGVIEHIAFHSGQPVRSGQLLLSVDPGALPGRLQEAQADAALAREDYVRARRVYAIRGISTATLDKAKYEAMASAARVSALQESLADTILRAPFSGVLGLRKIYRGQYLRTGTPVVELIDPRKLYVDFSVPQGDAAQVHAGTGLTFALPGAHAERQYPARILALNTQVGRSNRALAVRARILGDHPLARPGMFVLVQLPTGAARRRLLVPRIAIDYHSYGDFIYVLQRRKDGRWVAHEQSIRTGSVRGSDIVVRSGLKAGDRIVTAGQVKLHDGDPVRINNAVHLD